MKKTFMTLMAVVFAIAVNAQNYDVGTSSKYTDRYGNTTSTHRDQYGQTTGTSSSYTDRYGNTLKSADNFSSVRFSPCL